MKKNLILIGMMGAGKSTIGAILAKNLNLNFIDVDKILEKKQSMTIQEIFAKKGEVFFRKIEEEETKKIVKMSNVVVALGGGAFLNEKVRKIIKKTCVSIWLNLRTSELYKRTIINKKRPLLSNIKNEKELEKLYEERRKIYALSDHNIDCNYKDKNAIVKKIKIIYDSQ